ncbi:MAG: hypothetical protein V4591_10505, partial [Bdellovibrionota bacterium]
MHKNKYGTTPKSVRTIAILTFILIIFFYFLGIHNLQNEINQATENMRELSNIKPSYVSVNQQFERLVEDLRRNNQYNSIVSVLDQRTKEIGVESSTMPLKPPLIELQNNDPLFAKFQKVKIEYKISNISLTKIIEYIN